MIVMPSAKGDFPNYEIGPNLARVVRNAHWTVLIVQDCTY
jgi:universal stress protein F